MEQESSSSSANTTNDNNSQAQSPEKKDANEQSDIDLEDMLENSVEKSDSEGNNVQKHVDVQKDVELEELDEGTETDNVQMDTEEHVIGEVREGAVNNVQKSQPSEENETEENEKDNDLDNVQNSTSDQNQAEDNKQDKPLENEQSINDAHEITKEKTGQDEEQNANVDDMQVEQQSSNDDSQEDRKLKMIKRMIFKNRRKLIMCRKTVKSRRDGYYHVAQIQAKRPANFLKMLGAK